MPSYHDVIMCHILVITCHRKFNPVRSSIFILSIPLSMYEILKKISSDTTYHITSLIQRIRSLMHVAKATIFVKFLLPWQPFQNILLLLVVKI